MYEYVRLSRAFGPIDVDAYKQLLAHVNINQAERPS